MIYTSTKEHVEYVVRVKVVLISLVMIPLLILLAIVLFGTSLIIDCSFFRVAETHESLIDFLKSLFCLGISVLVRVYFK